MYIDCGSHDRVKALNKARFYVDKGDRQCDVDLRNVINSYINDKRTKCKSGECKPYANSRFEVSNGLWLIDQCLKLNKTCNDGFAYKEKCKDWLLDLDFECL